MYDQLNEKLKELNECSREESGLVLELREVDAKKQRLIHEVSQLQRSVKPTVVLPPKKSRKVRENKIQSEVVRLLKEPGLDPELVERVKRILGI